MSAAHGRQRGVAMLEAMIAALVLAIGLVGLGLLLARQLVEMRRNSAHAIAVQHIDSIRDSLRVNREAALKGWYGLTWSQARSAAVDCRLAACDATQLADHDLALWGRSLRAALPSAQAAIAGSPNSPQLTVAVAWPAAERAMNALDKAMHDAVTELTTGNDGIECPPAHLCHVGHVSP